MPKTTHYSSTAYAWAQSALSVANDQKQAEPLDEELKALAAILKENPIFNDFLSDPGIGQAQRAAALDRILGTSVSPLLRHLLKVMADRRSLKLLDEIAGAYDVLLQDQLGKVEVDVTTAHALSPEQLENVRQRVSAALKRDAVLHQYVDDSIIGGLVLRVGDQLIDGSVKAQLEIMREKLLASRPH